MLRAFSNEIDIELELSWTRLRGKSQVAKHVTLFHIAFASYPQFLERATSLLRAPHRSDATYEEATQREQPGELAREATVEPHERYSLLLHDLDFLITAAQMLSHRRREDAWTRSHLHHSE